MVTAEMAASAMIDIGVRPPFSVPGVNSQERWVDDVVEQTRGTRRA
ncbi:MAG: hypothetical protein P6D49_02550 [Acidimicrobiales bacterium]|nr:hypothetical protein [Acidimicrobiales bacterium]